MGSGSGRPFCSDEDIRRFRRYPIEDNRVAFKVLKNLRSPGPGESPRC